MWVTVDEIQTRVNTKKNMEDGEIEITRDHILLATGRMVGKKTIHCERVFHPTEDAKYFYIMKEPVPEDDKKDKEQSDGNNSG